VSYPIFVWQEGGKSAALKGNSHIPRTPLAASVSVPNFQGRDGPTMTQGTEAIPRGLVPTGKDSWLQYGRC
jgi:hypothetical protein